MFIYIETVIDINISNIKKKLYEVVDININLIYNQSYRSNIL